MYMYIYMYICSLKVCMISFTSFCKVVHLLANKVAEIKNWKNETLELHQW